MDIIQLSSSCVCMQYVCGAYSAVIKPLFRPKEDIAWLTTLGTKYRNWILFIVVARLLCMYILGYSTCPNSYLGKRFSDKPLKKESIGALNHYFHFKMADCHRSEDMTILTDFRIRHPLTTFVLKTNISYYWVPSWGAVRTQLCKYSPLTGCRECCKAHSWDTNTTRFC